LSPREASSSLEILRRFRVFARTGGIVVAVVGGAGLLTWVFNFDVLHTPGGLILYPNAALSWMFTGCALTITERVRRKGSGLRNFLAVTAGLLGLLTLLEYSLRIDLHIDELMFRDGSEVHGRMAVATATNFVLLSIALLAAERKKSAVLSQLMVGAAGLLCVLASLANLYSVPALFSFGAKNGMAIPSMFCCLIVCGGILALQADRGLMAVITSDGPGGVISRMLLPAALFVPALLGWIQWKGQFTYELYSSSAGLALFTASLIVVFVSMILVGAALLNRSDLERMRMEFEASHDGLTKILNRTGILEMLRVELIRSGRERKPISVILGDVDHFKSVNDELGHAAGDEVLKEVARRLKLSLRDYDGVGRFGGEEFLMVLPACELSAAVKRAELICAAMASEPIVLPDLNRKVTMSLGVSVVEPTSPNRQDSLIQAADVALYEAKNGGRNQVRAMVPKPLPELAGVAGD
jgi:diguanylate cyclase (GGDEF)-like protein